MSSSIPLVLSPALLAAEEKASGVDSSGMISSDPSPGAPTNVDMNDPDNTQTSGFLDKMENFGLSVVHGAEATVETVYGAGKTVVGDVVTGAEGVVQKTVNIGTGAVSSVTMNIVMILVVVGIGLVFIARSGAVKVSR